MELVVRPASIKGVRKKRGNSHDKLEGTEVLVQWQDLSEQEATWEDFEKLDKQFPEFHLGDKVKLWAAGNDNSPPLKVYQRNRRKAQMKNSPIEWCFQNYGKKGNSVFYFILVSYCYRATTFRRLSFAVGDHFVLSSAKGIYMLSLVI